jgi:hypothetical protein
LDGHIQVVHPLPGEDYSQEASCIEKWTFAIPNDFPASTLPLPEELKSDQSWLHAQDDSIKPLRRYVRDSSAPRIGEGLVILAHHDRGKLVYRRWNEQYEEDRYYDDPILSADFNRNYGNGSAAILLVCDAGAVRTEDLDIVTRLPVFGVDTVVVSPFSLGADYGRAFAIGFAEAVRRARAAGRSASITELFALAASTATELLQLKKSRNYKGMDLELIIAGNHTLELCTSKKSE